ncbi:MAG TPA: LuxR family transcriptional regulator [Rhodospirillaceae bacterium]|nr:LuxR family transcriptional regulator [Rhodospirillaceae bacterium]
MDLPPNDPQILLKATPPRLRKSELFRKRLSSEAADFRDKEVLFVRAPEGFGKTTLLGQWRREWLRTGAVVAWLTCDERDDGQRFLQGLQVTMQRGSGRPAFGQKVLKGKDESGLEALTEWLAEVSELAVETILILDDGHLLPELTVRHSLAYLTRNLPPNLRLVIGARERLAVPISDIAHHGQYTLLGVETLRFRFEETIALLASRFKLDIHVDQCARLHDITEGWPLGLALAVAVIEKSSGIEEGIRSLSAEPHHIDSYFIDTLLARLPPEALDFLVRISVLDAIHPSLCQEVTGREDAETMLARLAAGTPVFIEAVDSAWMRIHSLARRFLLRRFDGLPEADRLALHRRTADWLAGQDMFEAAAQHAFRAGETDKAYDYLEVCLLQVTLQGNSAAVLEWKERLPAEIIERRPMLRLAIGWALGFSDRHGEAIKLVQPILDDAGASLSDRCESAAIIAGAAIFADDLSGSASIIVPWLDQAAGVSPHLAPILANFDAVFAIYRGATEQARYLISRAGEEKTARREASTVWADWLVGFSYLWEGQAVLAERVLRPALARVEAELGRRNPLTGMLATALAAVLWERDLPAEAEALLADRLHVLERLTSPEAIIMGYQTAARLAAQAGEERRAQDLLQRLFAIGETRRIERFCIASLGERIRLAALRSHQETCRDLGRRLETLVAAGKPSRDPILAPLVEAKLALAQSYVALAHWDLDQVQRHLDCAGGLVRGLNLGRDGVGIKLLRSLVMMRRHEDGAAGLFLEGLGLAGTLGLQRILADTHPLLVDWGKRMDVPDQGRAAAAAPPRVAQTGLLTPKETEILHYLARNMSNKEIALAFDVSDETVKWHLKNLFGKLHANTRRHLVDRARTLGILDSRD